MTDQLLIIEDEQLLGTELQRHYRRAGWDVLLAPSIKAAERLLNTGQADPVVVLSDLALPDGNGLDLLDRLHKRMAGGSEWIFLTGYGEAPDAVRALRLGAFDFLTKPCDTDRLDLVVAGAARSATAQRRLVRQTRQEGNRYQPDAYLGRSVAAQSVRDMLSRLGGVPFSAVTITGETGTGKGLAAKILHYSGQRASAPFVEVNCAALPHDLLESELFGHEAGAFTGAKGRHKGLMEQAQGGTLFLDEIGEMPVSLQPKLLKAIEDRQIRRLGGEQEIRIDVQIIAATNSDITKEAQAGRFRVDLYHRLNVFEIDLPALRDRTEDLEDLAATFVTEFNVKAKKKVRIIPEDIWAALRAYEWPGNVRELRNVIERSVLLSESEVLPSGWMNLRPVSAASDDLDQIRQDGTWLHLPLDGSMALEDMDRHIIETALKRHEFNVTATARALGTTRETLRYRIQKYGLHREHASG